MRAAILIPGSGAAGTITIFWVGADHGAEGLGENGEGDVAMPAKVGAALKVVQAEAGLQLAVVMLNQPPLMPVKWKSSLA